MPWEKKQDEFSEQLADLAKLYTELSNHVEEMRLAQKSGEEAQDVELDSNWHIRRRQLERQFAKGVKDAE